MMMRTQPNIKAETISALADIRMKWRNIRSVKKPGEESGFISAAVALFTLIEKTSDGDSLWTTLPTENELNEHSTIGDHLAVTRKLLGFTP